MELDLPKTQAAPTDHFDGQYICAATARTQSYQKNWPNHSGRQHTRVLHKNMGTLVAFQTRWCPTIQLLWTIQLNMNSHELR